MDVVMKNLWRCAVIGLVAFFVTGCGTPTVRLSLSQPKQHIEEQLKRIKEASEPPPNEGSINYRYDVKIDDYARHIPNLLCALWELSTANTRNYLCVGDKKLLFDICPRYGGWASWRTMVIIDVMKEGLILREVGNLRLITACKRKMTAEELATVIEEHHVEQVFLQLAEDANGLELFSFLRTLCDKEYDIELYVTNWIELDDISLDNL